MKPKLLITSVLLAFLAGVLAFGCVQEPVKPTPTPTPTETPFYTPISTPTPLPATPTPAEEGKTIWIESYSFQPREITIKSGTMVVWRNWLRDRYEDVVIIGEDNWKSPSFGYGKTWNRTFYTPGTYNYTASFSGTELNTTKGVIIVTP